MRLGSVHFHLNSDEKVRVFIFSLLLNYVPENDTGSKTFLEGLEIETKFGLIIRSVESWCYLREERVKKTSCLNGIALVFAFTR